MSDTTPVLATLARITDAWNAGDADAYGEQFTDDATYVVFDGHLLRGRTEIVQTHRFLFDGPLRGSRMTEPTTDDALVRFLRPDVAHLVVTGAVLPAGQETITADRRSVVSFLLVHHGGSWRVAAFQNTRATEAGGPR